MPRSSMPRPEILAFPDPFPGIDALMGSRRVRAWQAPRPFEFHCPDKVDESKAKQREDLLLALMAIREESNADVLSAKNAAFDKFASEESREDAADTLRELKKERAKVEIEYERKIEAAVAGIIVSHGGTVRGPAGAWLVEEDGCYFVVSEKECQSVGALRLALSSNPEALAAFDAKMAR